MTYNKPEVVNVHRAFSAIQGMEKPPETIKDNETGVYNATPGAYESDE